MNYSGANLKGYEIHMGRTDFLAPVVHAFTLTARSGQTIAAQDGVVRADGLIMGTYLHGIFDNDEYRRSLINALRIRKGLPAIASEGDTQKRKKPVMTGWLQ